MTNRRITERTVDVASQAPSKEWSTYLLVPVHPFPPSKPPVPVHVPVHVRSTSQLLTLRTY